MLRDTELLRQAFALHDHGALFDLLVGQEVQGRVRGLEFYGRDLPRVYRNAVRNFFRFHQRLPDGEGLPRAADHLFFSKFFRFFPQDPNPASKLNAALYLDAERFGDSIYIPDRRVFSRKQPLRETLSSAPGWWLKLDLGNSAQIQLPAILNDVDARAARRRLKRWLHSARYGWSWGEWWYSASRQRVFLEEDLTPRMPGDEYQFYMKSGRCILFKKKRVFASADGNKKRTTGAYYDREGRNIPGVQDGYTVPDDLSLSPHLDVMMSAAEQIAESFDHIRVDFIMLHEGPALGELTCCIMNARITYSTDTLEALVKSAVALDIPKRV